MDKNKLAEDWIDEKGYYNSGLRINTIAFTHLNNI